MAVLLAVACSDPAVGALRPVDPAEDGGAVMVTPDSGAGSEAEAGTRPVVFGRDIRPLMNRGDSSPFGCRRCHYRNGGEPQGIEIGGLDLTTLADLRKGGVSSKRGIVVAGNPDASAIVQKLEGIYPRGARMPKGRAPWSAVEIELVRRWIAEGAKGADDE